MSQQGDQYAEQEDAWWRELYGRSEADTGGVAAGDSLDERFSSASAIVGPEPLRPRAEPRRPEPPRRAAGGADAPPGPPGGGPGGLSPAVSRGVPRQTKRWTPPAPSPGGARGTEPPTANGSSGPNGSGHGPSSRTAGADGTGAAHGSGGGLLPETGPGADGGPGSGGRLGARDGLGPDAGLGTNGGPEPNGGLGASDRPGADGGSRSSGGLGTDAGLGMNGGPGADGGLGASDGFGPDARPGTNGGPEPDGGPGISGGLEPDDDLGSGSGLGPNGATRSNGDFGPNGSPRPNGGFGTNGSPGPNGSTGPHSPHGSIDPHGTGAAPYTGGAPRTGGGANGIGGGGADRSRGSALPVPVRPRQRPPAPPPEPCAPVGAEGLPDGPPPPDPRTRVSPPPPPLPVPPEPPGVADPDRYAGPAERVERPERAELTKRKRAPGAPAGIPDVAEPPGFPELPDLPDLPGFSGIPGLSRAATAPGTALETTEASELPPPERSPVAGTPRRNGARLRTPEYVGRRPPTYEAEPTSWPAADPGGLEDLVPDTVLDGARYGALTLRAGSLRGDSARYRGEPRRDALLTARFGAGDDALLLVAMASGARAAEGAHRAAREICVWLGGAVGRSHARLVEDIHAGRRDELKSGLHRLTDRTYGRLRVRAAELGLRPSEYTAGLRCLLLPVDPRCRTRVFFGVGPGGLFRLREGAWQDLDPEPREPVAEAEAEPLTGYDVADRITVDLGIPTPGTAPVIDPAEVPSEPFRFRASIARPGDTLLLCSAGLADPLRGEAELGVRLAERWARAEPPGLAEFLADVQLRVKGYADDRTACAVWEG
ncbi:protein phosphatase 2C domain-containing protein [Streptomyces abikoensis]|uniref:protein phosphatase 2C domain-containing protein n=1 Tax=Streptomyces abikoensis TaxID=97398 RepID=UPI001E2F5C00|nr:protein phosphatase 2C domain-containing protein [Streptomyces abikoensis]